MKYATCHYIKTIKISEHVQPSLCFLGRDQFKCLQNRLPIYPFES